MLKQLLDLWYVRLEVVAETEESRQQARTILILDQAGRIPYLQYNRQAEQLEIKTDRDPLELKAALESIKELQVLLPCTTLHFHAARKLSSQIRGEIVPMMLEVGMRTPEADRAWNLLARLCHSGACRAVAMSMRRERMGRSALAKQVQQTVEGLSGPCNSAIGATIAAPMRIDHLLRTLLPDPSAPYARGHDDAVWQCLRELLGEPDDQDPDVAAARRLALQPARLAPSVDSGSMCGARRSCRVRGCMGRRSACIAAAPS